MHYGFLLRVRAPLCTLLKRGEGQGRFNRAEVIDFRRTTLQYGQSVKIFTIWKCLSVEVDIPTMLATWWPTADVVKLRKL